MKQFKIRSVQLAHDGGTKDYNIVTITNPNTNATVQLRRWGKCGTLGQSKQMKFNNPRPAGVYAQKIIDDKTGGGHGYRVIYDNTVDVDESLVAEHIGRFSNGHALEDGMLKHLELDASQGGDFTVSDYHDGGYKEAAMVETVKPEVPEFYGQW